MNFPFIKNKVSSLIYPFLIRISISMSLLARKCKCFYLLLIKYSNHHFHKSYKIQRRFTCKTLLIRLDNTPLFYLLPKQQRKNFSSRTVKIYHLFLFSHHLLIRPLRYRFSKVTLLCKFRSLKRNDNFILLNRTYFIHAFLFYTNSG